MALRTAKGYRESLGLRQDLLAQTTTLLLVLQVLDHSGHLLQHDVRPAHHLGEDRISSETRPVFMHTSQEEHESNVAVLPLPL